MLSSRYSIVPAVGFNTPLITLMRVDFPDPLAPIIHSISPGFTDIVIFLNIWIFPYEKLILFMFRNDFSIGIPLRFTLSI